MDTVTHLFHHMPPLCIYLLVGTFLLLESSGIPIINTTLLLFVGAVASFGHLNIWLLGIVTICGSVCGASVAYTLGAHLGSRALARLVKLFRIDPRKVEMAQLWFQRSGTRMVFFSRIIPYIRPFACFPAGMAKMPFRRFFSAALAGSTIWCVTFLALGWQLGPRWKLAMHLLQMYTLPTVAAVLLLLIAGWLIKWRLSRFLETKLEASLQKKGEEETERDLLHVR